MWDGQWHFDVSPFLWVPWLYGTVQLPPVAGGATTTIETEPSDYLKYAKFGISLDGTARKGDWAIWTDVIYGNSGSKPSYLKQIGLPGGSATLPVSLSINRDVRAAIWALAPSYTVIRNDTGTLDLMAGNRYISFRLSLAYELKAPPTPLMRGGGFWPTSDSTDGILGVRGALRLSQDGKWSLPFEADVGAGSSNWQWNAMLGVGYHFHWATSSSVVAILRLTEPATSAFRRSGLPAPHSEQHSVGKAARKARHERTTGL